ASHRYPGADRADHLGRPWLAESHPGARLARSVLGDDRTGAGDLPCTPPRPSRPGRRSDPGRNPVLAPRLPGAVADPTNCRLERLHFVDWNNYKLSTRSPIFCRLSA